MGYARYTLVGGREAGYAVEATCDEQGCTAKINRGLGFLCGQTPGGDEWGCGDYFCSEHLYFIGVAGSPQLCSRCADQAVAATEEEEARP